MQQRFWHRAVAFPATIRALQKFPDGFYGGVRTRCNVSSWISNQWLGHPNMGASDVAGQTFW
ncbi:hypothetical protein SESBI_23482 [Sesbania bispinosa]|nr:hypothetical protein SESBI_23482 [Sesbania bispinosa]